MPDIFGVNIAGLINDALGDLVFDQQLIKVSSTRDPSDSTKRIQLRTVYPCKGFIDSYADVWVDGAMVQASDRKIIILGDTLDSGTIPECGDEISAEGKTFTIVANGVTRDPAGATFECRSN
jgi:hypothetical protein